MLREQVAELQDRLDQESRREAAQARHRCEVADIAVDDAEQRDDLSRSGDTAAGRQEPYDYRERADHRLAGECRLTALFPQQRRRLVVVGQRRRKTQRDRGIGEIVQAQGNRFRRTMWPGCSET